jgi:hypothetical protein
MVIPNNPTELLSARSVVTDIVQKLLLICAIGGGSLALTHVALQSAHRDRKFKPGNDADGGIITRTELLQLWLPGTLIDLAQHQTGPSCMRTHQELQRILDGRQQRNLWYALTFRAYQVNGRFEDLTFIRWPYIDSARFPELLDILGVAAGEPPSDANFGSSTPTVSVLPDRLLNHDPREVMRKAMGTGLESWCAPALADHANCSFEAAHPIRRGE